jgi:hypothetical protein
MSGPFTGPALHALCRPLRRPDRCRSAVPGTAPWPGRPLSLQVARGRTPGRPRLPSYISMHTWVPDTCRYRRQLPRCRVALVTSSETMRVVAAFDPDAGEVDCGVTASRGGRLLEARLGPRALAVQRL